jgi:hypothetical protein
MEGAWDEANRAFFFHGDKASAAPVLTHRRVHIKGERVVIAPYGRLMAAPSGSGGGNALVFHPTG